MPKIQNHLLEDIKFEKLDALKNFTLSPKYIVIHYTGGTSVRGTFSTLKGRKLSYHVIIDRDGEMTQCVAFNKGAKHAGKSNYRGTDDLNRHSIGICLANRGYVSPFRNGKFASIDGNNRRIGGFLKPNEVVKQQHPNEAKARFWEKYSAEQLTTVRELCKELIDAYPSIVDIVGHDEVSVGRKADPGPAFPMTSFYDLVPQRGITDRNAFTVNTPNDTLNVRSGPSRYTDANGALQHQQVIFPRSFCYKRNKRTNKMEKSDWLSISLDERHLHNGFVHARFLKRLE